VKKLLVAPALALLLAAFADVPHPAPSDPHSWNGARPEVRVRVKPIRDTDTFLVSAVVTDTRDGRVLAGPSMTVKAGVPANAEVGTTGGPDARSFAFTVVVAADGNSATYRSEIRNNSDVLAAQDSVLAITP